MDGSDILTLVLRLGAGAAIIVIIYCVLFGRRADFVVRVKHGRVVCKGKISLAMKRRLSEFLLHEMGLTQSVRIMGARRGEGMVLWFRGRITPGQQQRIRNFIKLGP